MVGLRYQAFDSQPPKVIAPLQSRRTMRKFAAQMSGMLARSCWTAALLGTAITLSAHRSAFAQAGQTESAAPADDDDACFVITGLVRNGFQPRLRILAKRNQADDLLAKGYEPIDCRGYEQAVSELADKICVFDKDATADEHTAFEGRFGIDAKELCKITGGKKLKERKQNSYENWLEKMMR